MVVLGLLVGVGAVSTISGPKVNDIACLFQLGGVSADYVHNSLPSDTSIRLLYLKRPDSEQDNVIRCSLKEVELAKPPDYIAVSYTWGLPEKRAEAYETHSARDHTIYVDSKPFQVTENLHDALLFFRSLLDVEDYPLWIDAICINQKDYDEKGKQVSMMGTIYNQADRVVVWLGKDERGDGPGIARMITHLADAWNQYPMKDN
ncbi:hypothetical protein LTS15_002102 [Exophiala xenobiotica]|nr:hypothetical protein LTS15_002102 [Exophiala xenobiotica]